MFNFSLKDSFSVMKADHQTEKRIRIKQQQQTYHRVSLGDSAPWNLYGSFMDLYSVAAQLLLLSLDQEF